MTFDLETEWQWIELLASEGIDVSPRVVLLLATATQPVSVWRELWGVLLPMSGGLPTSALAHRRVRPAAAAPGRFSRTPTRLADRPLDRNSWRARLVPRSVSVVLALGKAAELRATSAARRRKYS